MITTTPLAATILNETFSRERIKRFVKDAMMLVAIAKERFFLSFFIE